MSRLTVRLPESLHKEISAIAAKEGVSLNQYVVYALTRQSAVAGDVDRVTGLEIQQQAESLKLLRQELGRVASPAEIAEFLAGRELAQSDERVSDEVMEKFRAKIADSVQ